MKFLFVKILVEQLHNQAHILSNDAERHEATIHRRFFGKQNFVISLPMLVYRNYVLEP